jgi:hypothetical protein
MPAFLHQRVSDAAGLLKLAETNAYEGQLLEFKPDLTDAAKEVAALANAEGGDLIIGAHTLREPATNRDRWERWADLPRPSEKDLRQLLQNAMAPREMADTVEILPLEVQASSRGTLPVLVANVPPWPYGPVGIQSAIDVQQASYRFPIRRDAHTRYMSFEEIMRLSEGSRRSTYLRLRQLLGNPIDATGVPFRLLSVMQGVGGRIEPVIDHDGVIADATQELLRIVLIEREWVLLAEFREKVPAAELSVPLELVVAAWKVPGEEVASLVLATPIIWDGYKFMFNFTRSFGGAG